MVVTLVVMLDDYEKTLYQQICSSPEKAMIFPLPNNSVSAAKLACALQHLEDSHLIYILQSPSESSPVFEAELSESGPFSNEEL